MKAAALWLALAQGGAPELALRVTAAAQEVEFGAPFALTVERTWSAELEPEPFDDALLAPLAVTLLERSSRATAAGFEETRRYRAQAFRREELFLPALELRARQRVEGHELVARSDALHLRVRSSLAAEQPGPAELPAGPLPAPPRRRALGAWLAVALASGALALWSWRRWSRASERGAGSTPQGAALAGLDRLARYEPTRLVLELAAVLRAYIEAAYELPAARRTSEELLDALENLRAANTRELAALRALLASCDRAKFSGRAPSAREATELNEAARAFVRAGAPREAAA